MKVNPYATKVDSRHSSFSKTENGSSDLAKTKWNSFPRVATGVAIFAYGLSLMCEAAYYAGGIGFNEVVTLERLLDALSCVVPADIAQREFGPTDLIAIAGMFATLFLTLDRIRACPTAVLAAYVFLFVILGGWIGLVVVLYAPFMFWQQIDGEFFADGVARFVAIGIWAGILVILMGWKFVDAMRSNRVPTGEGQHSRSAEQGM